MQVQQKAKDTIEIKYTRSVAYTKMHKNRTNMVDIGKYPRRVGPCCLSMAMMCATDRATKYSRRARASRRIGPESLSHDWTQRLQKNNPHPRNADYSLTTPAQEVPTTITVDAHLQPR